MGLPTSNSASSQMKNAYKKYLHAFEDFYRKLGSTMGTLSRPGRHRNNSGRSILPFRGRDKDTPNSPRIKKEEKEIDDSCSDRSKTTKSDDTSDNDSLFKEDSDSETPTTKRSVTRRDKQKEEKEKRESLKLKIEEEEKRSSRREKDDDKNSLKDEKVTPKKEKNDSDEKEDSIKKRVTRRKSGRGGEEGKKEEEEEEEEKVEIKKKGKGSDKEEKKPEDKKLTRKDLKEKKVDVKMKEDKNNKDDKNSVKDETEDDEEELIFKMEEDDKKKELLLGTKVRVKYGRGKNIKLYEAKVVEAGKDGTQKTYLVHYAGWNNRYDEWIKRERIVGILDRPDSAKKQLKKQESMVPSPGSAPKISPKPSLKQQLVNQIQKKRGRPGVGTPPPNKSAEFRIPTTRSPQPTQPTTNNTPVAKNRPTRSNSLDSKTTLELTPGKKRRVRKSSDVNDNSDQQSRESDESTDTDEEMETDEKIPDLSETGSLSKTPEREEPESEMETNIEEEAPELEAMKPLEELPPVTQEPPPISPEKPEEKPKSPGPVEIEPVLEPVLEKTPNKPIKDPKENLKDVKEKPKEVKEKPKEVKEKPKEVKEKPKEVKEKPKEVKEKPKEPKEKPKDIKEKLRELKEMKDKMKEMKDKTKEKEKPKEMTPKVKEIKEKVKETKETRRIVVSEPKPAETKAASIYDFEDTEIGEDFKIEEKKVKKDLESDFDIENLEDIVNSFLCPDPSRLDRVEEIQMKLEVEKEENEKKKNDLVRRLDQFEEMLRTESKLEVKEDGEKKMKKKDLKDSAKKDNKDGKAGLKRGRPPLDKSMTDLPLTPKADPMFTSSAILTSLTKKVIESPLEEPMDGKLKKDILDSKTKKEKKRDSSEKVPSVEDDKLSDYESKELVDNLEKKKVKKKIKKKIFGENLNDSSEPLAFSDLNKDNLDLIKTDLKKDIKTPKSANKDKTPKPKESKKAKDNDFSKELSSPVLTSAINSTSVTEFSSEKKEKRIRSRSVSPVDRSFKAAKFEDSDKKTESLVELNVPKVVSSYSKEVKVLEVSSDSAIISQSVTEIESKTSVVAAILDCPNPRNPEQLKLTAVPSASSVQEVKSKEDNSNVCDQMSNSGGESPNTVNNNCCLEGTESSSVIPSSENSNDVDTLQIKRKRDSDDQTPTKKQKRRSTKASKQAERNRSKFNGSDSEDTNSSKFPSPNHTPGSPHKHFDSPRQSRSPKYNFHLEQSNDLFGERKIIFITDKMKEIRQMYLTLKTEVANIDKKRKRARRKERDSQSSHIDNESS